MCKVLRETFVLAMDENQAGSSEVQKRRVTRKTSEHTVRNKYPLPEKEMEKYLLDFDDDIADPESNSDEWISDNSDSEAELPLDNTTLDQSDADMTSDILDLPQVAAIPPVPQRPVKDAVIWNSDEYVPTQIRFTKKNELLVQPNGMYQFSVVT